MYKNPSAAYVLSNKQGLGGGGGGDQVHRTSFTKIDFVTLLLVCYFSPLILSFVKYL
jgi:hypothetical protein